MLANPGEAVDDKGNKSRKWAIMAKVSFFEQKKVKAAGMGENTQLA